LDDRPAIDTLEQPLSTYWTNLITHLSHDGLAVPNALDEEVGHPLDDQP
jgi:hypothetical protein